MWAINKDSVNQELPEFQVNEVFMRITGMGAAGTRSRPSHPRICCEAVFLVEEMGQNTS